jgi:hypothetical protein
MKKNLVGILISVWLGLAAPAAGAVNAAKMDLLQQRISEIQALQTLMDEIRSQAAALQGTLQAKVAEYSLEIRKEQADLELKTFDQAIKVYRVRYNLKLVQQISAYLAAVSERIAFFQEGRERVDFLLQQAQDDLKMVQTLSDMEIADFIGRMDPVLAKYKEAANSNLFNIETIRQEKLEALWLSISTAK